jgi:hypothetical protein
MAAALGSFVATVGARRRIPAGRTRPRGAGLDAWARIGDQWCWPVGRAGWEWRLPRSWGAGPVVGLELAQEARRLGYGSFWARTKRVPWTPQCGRLHHRRRPWRQERVLTGLAGASGGDRTAATRLCSSCQRCSGAARRKPDPW